MSRDQQGNVNTTIDSITQFRAINTISYMITLSDWLIENWKYVRIVNIRRHTFRYLYIREQVCKSSTDETATDKADGCYPNEPMCVDLCVQTLPCGN